MASAPARKLVLLIAIAAAALVAVPAAASARSCAKPKLRLSKLEVRDGARLGVRGAMCRRKAPGRVVVQVKAGKRWKPIARTRARHHGRFKKRVRLASRGRGFVRVRIRASHRKSRSRRVRIVDEGCMLSNPSPAAQMALPGCRVLGSDTAVNRDPAEFWGYIACQDSARVEQLSGGADPHPTALGQAQPDSSFRRTTVLDGDDSWGERCELGENDHQSGPTAFYREGQRRVTFLSLRLPSNFPLESSAWQSVMQMKQAQPADGGGGVPILMMDAMRGQWVIDSDKGVHWTFPAQRNLWTRFAFDVLYSQDPGQGWLQVSADLNADGDFADGGEQSSVIHTATLKTEIDGPNGSTDGLAAGDSIPSHLRAGVYHNTSIPCPPPGGCSVEVDNVQVLAP